MSLLAAVAIPAGVLSVIAAPGSVAGRDLARTWTSTATSTSAWTYKTLRNPDRVQVLDGSPQPVATFTLGARTVTVRGAARTFVEPSTTTATVVHRTWVRLLPAPFSGKVDTAWLQAALADTSPDVLSLATQYITGAPTVRAVDGSVVSSDADYGPLLADGSREEGADFNDYLRVTWAYGSQLDAPESRQLGALDCSGFVRIVLGYRAGAPLAFDPNGVGLPRRSFQMLDSAAGVVTVRNTGATPSSTSALAPGDLLFFDGSTDDGTRIDHVGIYLGIDSAGAPRFISSRKTVNGPTLGDVGGRSVLSGTGLYAKAWRAARRV